MLANGIWAGGGLGAVAVMVGVESASGGGSASTDLHASLALLRKLHDLTRNSGVCSYYCAGNWTRWQAVQNRWNGYT